MGKISSKEELFSRAPVGQALLSMAVPTIISQIVSLIYNMVDAFFIGRTGNSYMMAATTITLTMLLMNVALSNLFGIGGGSLVARMMGAGRPEEARKISAMSVYGGAAIALIYSLLTGAFLNPLLSFLGASDATIGYARSYALIVIVIGSLPMVMSMTLAHLLRNTGYSKEASIGLSGGGILNMILDPIFMFVILPKGMEVTGAAIATTLSNFAACLYLLIQYGKARSKSPLSLSLKTALTAGSKNLKAVLSVGIPSAILTGLFDIANICVNILAASHNDLVLAGMGIVMKVERLPNAINIGICQGMMPIVAYNFSAGNYERMDSVIKQARRAGLAVSGMSILLFELFATPVVSFFLSTSAGDSRTALITIGYAALFIRIRALASPVQFINYHTSYSLQAMGDGVGTLVHAFVRELVFYIPLMFILDKLFGEAGLAAALPVGEACGAIFALYLLHRWLKKHSYKEKR